jgi:hypothetical protein
VQADHHRLPNYGPQVYEWLQKYGNCVRLGRRIDPLGINTHSSPNHDLCIKKMSKSNFQFKLFLAILFLSKCKIQKFLPMGFHENAYFDL